MSIEQANIIDFVTVSEAEHAVLSISDHLSWEDVGSHLSCLQDKINAYLRFIESGELYAKYPETKNLPIIIDLVQKYAPPEQTKPFFENILATIENAGFELRVRSLSE